MIWLIPLVWGFLILVAVINIVNAIISSGKRAGNRSRRSISDDGHAVPRSQDLTCETKYGHDHGGIEAQKRYIVHEDPEEGFVVLNGIKRRIKDCKYL